MCINEGGLAALGSGPLGGLSRQLPQGDLGEHLLWTLNVDLGVGTSLWGPGSARGMVFCPGEPCPGKQTRLERPEGAD